MVKSAYIIRINGIDEKNYRRRYETEESIVLIAGTSDEISGRQMVLELIRDGYVRICLGYGFTESDAEWIRGSEEFLKTDGNKVKLQCVSYTINEYAKLKKLDRMRSHGIIMAVPGTDRTASLFISDKVHDIRAVFVKNMAQARQAARHLVKHNAGFIELCIWFDRLRMEEVIRAVGGAVPVGTCGDLTMKDLEPEMDPDILMPKKRVYKRRK